MLNSNIDTSTVHSSLKVNGKTSIIYFAIDKRGIVFERAAAAWGESCNWKLPPSAN